MFRDQMYKWLMTTLIGGRPSILITISQPSAPLITVIIIMRNLNYCTESKPPS